VFDSLRCADVPKFRLLIPPLDEQQEIASLLGALDDKIELNRQTNETLEALARAIFKEWFVDCGPPRAKAEGREPYLAPELWELFPDVFDDEDKPEGWELSEIGKEVRAVGGATPSTNLPIFWETGEHNWSTPKDLSKLKSPVLLFTERKISNIGLEKISSGLLPVGTVLLSSRAPIGYLAIAETPTAVNQGFIAMVCDKCLTNLFVFFWCEQNLEYIKGIAGGSTFAEISKKVFRPIPIVVPANKCILAFDEIVRPLYNKIVSNTKENETLAQTRDLLLPQLMSGEIRLQDAERIVGEVV
jgi:type I restriction enzyme S subunit